MTTVRPAMLRRVFALILALACAFAPALWAIEQAAPAATADSCCCGTACPCPPTDCAPPPTAPTNSAPQSTASAAEQRTLAAKPRARAATVFFAHFLSAPSSEPALTVRTRATHADGFAPAARVPLYEAHCSFLI